MPFTISIDYLESIYPENGRCPVLDIPLNFGSATGSEDSPSLDRIVPEKGYVEGNLIFTSELANRVKSNASPETILKVAEFYLKLAEDTNE